MTESREPDADKVPDDEELQEPSTEKEPDEEPKDAESEPEEADHQAVGIGVVDGPAAVGDDSGEQVSPPHPTAAETAKPDSAPPTDAVTDDVKRDTVDAPE
ncbi:MAG: hypothetical protein J0I70_02910 [Microbacterium sp.]|uniref:hypothetical protein n=1 Tax=Microbacterium sp. TaxID=51671 RepID=UPI000928DCC1|nr:hypothetical protein [Microbacterium sp.]MBN9173088.1 hypothetical protein [Microbacterium sp.]MBN9190960.1 hypothetical protein [Microbacterium sp.]MBN9193983.1 hypothetical protein [Microbacterium sp.]OJU57114.1 MAG: hypothetical protein BGO04_03790 [Microbacterium sp. 70-38]